MSKKVYTWKEANDIGFIRTEFSSAEAGSFIGTLVFKIWGDTNKPCIYCYFTTDDGKKLKLTAFWQSDTGFYGYYKSDIDFKTILLGTKWDNRVTLNKKGNPKWILANEVL